MGMFIGFDRNDRVLEYKSRGALKPNKSNKWKHYRKNH